MSYLIGSADISLYSQRLLGFATDFESVWGRKCMGYIYIISACRFLFYTVLRREQGGLVSTLVGRMSFFFSCGGVDAAESSVTNCRALKFHLFFYSGGGWTLRKFQLRIVAKKMGKRL